MKVLLSAYACEPGKGSEPGVGWRWAIEIARRGHKVMVLTRANNRANIEAGIASDPDYPTTIQFAYYDLPPWALSLKRSTGAVLLYYATWQWGAYRLAKQLHADQRFDVVHHITFGGVRHFSLMWNLKAQFVLGPIGGGETSPFWLRWKTGLSGGFRDTIRDILNFLSRIDPIMMLSFSRSKKVFTKTFESLRLIPISMHYKSYVQMEIGIDMPCENNEVKLIDRHKQILFVGRFIYLKGMRIGLDAFARSLKQDSNLRLTMVGRGPEEKRWRRYAQRLGVTERINWIPWLTQKELKGLYESCGVLLFPSLHDSSGNVVLEALSHGLPVICLKLGGPGEIVNDNCGCAISVNHGNYERLIGEMAQAIIHFTETPEKWGCASERARVEAKKWNWASRVEALRIY